MDDIRGLARHADRDNDGQLIIITVPDYVDRLPSTQRLKILSACRTVLSKQEIDRADVADCLTNHFIKDAGRELEALLVKTVSDGSIESTDILPQLNPGDDFPLLEGTLGPENDNGLEGTPGKLSITISVKK